MVKVNPQASLDATPRGPTLYHDGHLAPWKEELQRRMTTHFIGTEDEFVALWYESHEKLLDFMGGTVVDVPFRLDVTSMPYDVSRDSAMYDALSFIMNRLSYFPDTAALPLVTTHQRQNATSACQQLFRTESINGRLKASKHFARVKASLEKHKATVSDEEWKKIVLPMPTRASRRTSCTGEQALRMVDECIKKWESVIAPMKKRLLEAAESPNKNKGIPYTIRVHIHPTAFAGSGFMKIDSQSCYGTAKECGWVPTALMVSEGAVFYEIYQGIAGDGIRGISAEPFGRAWGFVEPGVGASMTNWYTKNDEKIKQFKALFHKAVAEWAIGEPVDAMNIVHYSFLGELVLSDTHKFRRQPYLNGDGYAVGKTPHPEHIGKWVHPKHILSQRVVGTCQVSGQRIFEGNAYVSYGPRNSDQLALRNLVKGKKDYVKCTSGRYIPKDDAIPLCGGRYTHPEERNELVVLFDGTYERRSHAFTCGAQGFLASIDYHPRVHMRGGGFGTDAPGVDPTLRIVRPHGSNLYILKSELEAAKAVENKIHIKI